MSPVEGALLAIFMASPFVWLVHRHFAQLDDPGYLRTQGVVIVSDRALDARSPAIGEYMGCPVWGTITFKGMVYRFDHVIEARKREFITARELYLEPGLVYVTD